MHSKQHWRKRGPSSKKRTSMLCRYDQLKLIRILSSKEKGSTSDSVIALARNVQVEPYWTPDRLRAVLREETLGDLMIYKFSFGITTPTNNSLFIERLVYEQLILPMVTEHICPHYILPLTNYTCGHMHLLDIVPERDRAQLVSLMRDSQINGIDKIVHVLGIEKSQGKTVLAFIMDTVPKLARNTLDYDMMCIFFQLIYATACMHAHGIRHNDLHLGNVFVDTLTAPQCIEYRIPGENIVVRMKTQFVVKVYDFDRVGSIDTPSSVLQQRNSLLDDTLCDKYGECNEVNDSFDLFMIFHAFLAVFRVYSMRTMEEFLFRVFPDFDEVDRRQNEFAVAPAYLCSEAQLRPGKKATQCHGDVTLQPAQLMSATEIMRSCGEFLHRKQVGRFPKSPAAVFTYKRISARDAADIDTPADDHIGMHRTQGLYTIPDDDG